MRMTNKMKSMRIGTASSSEQGGNPRGIPSRGSNLAKISVPYEGQSCAYCGSKSGARRIGLVWTGNLMLGCFSGVLMAGLLLFVVSLLNSSTERILDHHAFGHWVWHEPLNDWNL